MANAYKNYSILIAKRKKLRGRLCLCGNPATEIHHKDLSTNNHKLNNLQPLCRFCHVKIHNPMRAKIYVDGYNLHEWAQMLSVSYSAIWGEFYNPLKKKPYSITYLMAGKLLGVTKQRAHQLHKEGKLKDLLANLQK